MSVLAGLASPAESTLPVPQPDENHEGREGVVRRIRSEGVRERSLNEVAFLTVAEVASVMRVSKMTVYRLVHSGHLPAIRVGRSFRVPEQAVHEYVLGSYVRSIESTDRRDMGFPGGPWWGNPVVDVRSPRRSTSCRGRPGRDGDHDRGRVISADGPR